MSDKGLNPNAYPSNLTLALTLTLAPTYSKSVSVISVMPLHGMSSSTTS